MTPKGHSFTGRVGLVQVAFFVGAAGVASLGVAAFPLLACGVDTRSVSEGLVACEPNATRCTAEGLLQTCSDAALWQQPAACPFACSHGECVGECSPGERSCVLGNTPRHCDDAGAWQEEAACTAVCVAGECAPACTPDARACSGTDSLICSADGRFELHETCEYICAEATGECAGECQPNALRCAEADLQICGRGARWELLTHCSDGCTATGGRPACAGACMPGELRCSNATQVSVCTDAGQWGDAVDCQDDACRSVLQGCAACDASQVSCAGRCVELASDPDHCGRCGHSCLGASCTAGACAPVTLAEGSFGGLALAGSWLYLLENGIARLSTSGGSRETISSESLDTIAADRTYLYGTRRVAVQTAEFWRLPQTGGSLLSDGVSLGQGPWPKLLRVNSSSVVASFEPGGGSTGNDCELTRFDIEPGGSGPTQLLFRSDSQSDVGAEPGICYGLALDDATAYTIVRPSRGLPMSELWSAPLSGEGPQLVWAPESGEQLSDLALAGDRIVFASSTRLGAVSTSGGVSETLAPGSAYRVLFDGELAGPRAANAVLYYFSAVDAAGSCESGSLLYAISAGGGAPFLLAREPRPGCVQDFVSDADSLYWLTHDSSGTNTIGQLERAAKR